MISNIINQLFMDVVSITQLFSEEPLYPRTMQQWWSTEKISLVLMSFVLDSFVTSNISSTVLGKMTTDFRTLRTGGLKSVVRFSYTQTEGSMNDAALPQLLKHID